MIAVIKKKILREKKVKIVKKKKLRKDEKRL